MLKKHTCKQINRPFIGLDTRHKDMVLVDFKDYILSDPLQYMISQKIIHRTLVFSVEWLCLNSYVFLRSIDLVHTSDVVCSFDFSWYQNMCEFVMV